MKLKNAGFTVWEVVVVVGIIAILSAVAVPNLVGWRDRARIKGVFENLRGDLQWAKTRAVRDHNWVAVVFDVGRYEINDAAGATMRSRELSAGVVIDMGDSTIPVDPSDVTRLRARFDTRGRCPDDGLLVLNIPGGEQRQIRIYPLGQIRQE
jgi:type IV fimbrial biogenesis protein FimT